MLSPFKPHPLIRGGYLQTVAGQVFAEPQPLADYATESVTLSDGDQLVLHVDKPDTPTPKHPVVLLLHGLGGSSVSTYILRITSKLLKLGYEVVRFNHRGAAKGTEHLARNIYHAGRMADVHAALTHLAATRTGRPVLIAGFSLSANMLLRYLGEGSVAANISATLAVCPPIDLQDCADALAAAINRPIDLYYTRRLMQTADTRQKLFPDLKPTQFPKKMSLKRFDELYTAPQAGFGSASEYYAHASSKPLLIAVTVPTTILAAADDPVCPIAGFADARVSKHIALQIERSGGHMGFVSARPTEFGDRRWLDAAVVSWVRQHT